MAHGSQPYQRLTGEADGTVRIQGGREGTRLEMKVQEVKQSLETAFIDGTINSNLAYQPEFISNDYKQGKKVLVSLEKELKKCDENSNFTWICPFSVRDLLWVILWQFINVE